MEKYCEKQQLDLLEYTSAFVPSVMQSDNFELFCCFRQHEFAEDEVQNN